jgi:hypothetical protein
MAFVQEIFFNLLRKRKFTKRKTVEAILEQQKALEKQRFWIDSIPKNIFWYLTQRKISKIGGVVVHRVSCSLEYLVFASRQL